MVFDITVRNHVYASVSPILIDKISEEQAAMIYVMITTTLYTNI